MTSEFPIWTLLPLAIGLPVGVLVSLWLTVRSFGKSKDALANKKTLPKGSDDILGE